jgi:hypothetical protein
MNGVYDARELDQHAVAHELDDAAMEFFDRGVDDVTTAGLQPGKRANLVQAHEAAIADHIAGKDCSKPSLHTPA